MADFVTVAKANEIPVGGIKPVRAGERHVLVCHTADGFYVIDDTCTHDDGPLAGGFLDGDAIECPRHGARFDVRTGQVLCLPAAIGIKSYPVRLDGNDVKAQLA